MVLVTLCACDCGQVVSPGKTWRKGHCNRGVSREFSWITNGKKDRQLAVTAELPSGWRWGTATGGSKNKGKGRPDAKERMISGGAEAAARGRWGPKRPKYWRAYWTHKNNAKDRGVSFLLTFEEWLGVWEASGKNIGSGKGTYVMARTGDSGAYELGNVRIATGGENALEAYSRPEHAAKFVERIPRMLARRKVLRGY